MANMFEILYSIRALIGGTVISLCSKDNIFIFYMNNIKNNKTFYQFAIWNIFHIIPYFLNICMCILISFLNYERLL